MREKVFILGLIIFNVLIIFISTLYIFDIRKENIKLNTLLNVELNKKNQKNIIVNNFDNNIKPTQISNDNSEKWLIIGIPTIPRKNNEDYLLQTLKSIDESLPKDKKDPFFERIQIVIINHKPNLHSIFDKAKKEFERNNNFQFLEKDSIPLGNKKETQYIPFKVMKQTLDVIDLLREVKGKSEYFLFMEDDFNLCHNGIKSIYHLISKANIYHNKNWIKIRFLLINLIDQVLA
jgi:hypothetical protein